MERFDKHDDGINSEMNQKRVIGGGVLLNDGSKLPLWYVKSKHAIYYVLGVIEVLLGIRLIFMILGANSQSGFTSFIYSLTGIFTAPFSGIFNSYTTSGLVTRSVFDPATIIAMLVYALIAWGIVRLMWIKATRHEF